MADDPSPLSDGLARVFQALRPVVTIEPDGEGFVGKASFEPQAEHRGNPGWLHGGLAATVLDHTCARVAAAALDDRVVTATLDLRYPKPVVIAEGPYVIRAESAKARGRMVRVRGAILGPDGEPMVEAKALFVRLVLPSAS